MFYLIYKGRPYGEPMTRVQAEEKLELLRQTIDGLSIAELSEHGLLKLLRPDRHLHRNPRGRGKRSAAQAALSPVGKEEDDAGTVGDGTAQ